MNIEKGCNNCNRDEREFISPSHPFNREGCDIHHGYHHGCHNPFLTPPPPPKPPSHYPCDCPPPGRYPSSGSMFGNAFVLNNDTPYLYDNTLVQYGPFMDYSENVITRVTQRRDPACINLSATFDMTDSMNTNAMWCHFLEQTIINQYECLGGVLPIIKSGVLFKLYYDIRDSHGCVIHESNVKVISNDMRVHFTNIRDRFVNSCKDLIIVNIPRMDYRGLYTITLNRIEAYVETLDTLSHIKNGMNPYYQFTDNNLKIAVQHDAIDKKDSDNMILISACDILKSFNFQANITTRLKLSFIAFMSNLITPPNTYGVWSALNDSRNAIIRDLSHEIYLLKEELSILQSDVSITKDDIKNINDGMTIFEEKVDQVIIDTSDMKTNIETLVINVENLGDRVDSLEGGSANPIDTYTKGEIDAMISGINPYTKEEIDNLLSDKVDKVEGKFLSTNDFTDDYKEFIDNLSLTGNIVFSTHLEFPNVGEEKILYIASDEAKSYIWDQKSQTYIGLDNYVSDVKSIQSTIS